MRETLKSNEYAVCHVIGQQKRTDNDDDILILHLFCNQKAVPNAICVI